MPHVHMLAADEEASSRAVPARRVLLRVVRSVRGDLEDWARLKTAEG